MTSDVIQQVCRNGHQIEGPLVKYCPRCGTDTISQCPKCHSNLSGISKSSSNEREERNIKLPYYCHSCGDPFPWTVTTMETLEELYKGIDALNEEGKRVFIKDIEEIIKDSPKAKVAAIRIRTLIERIPPIAAKIVSDMITDISSDSIRKIILS